MPDEIAAEPEVTAEEGYPNGQPEPVVESDTPEVPVADEAANDGPSRQAAKYRTRLRDTEAQRDQLQQRVETMQRKEVERLAGARLADGGDVWLAGTELANMLDEAGDVDASKVGELVDEITANRPHWAAKAQAQAIRTGPGKFSSGASIAPPPTGWADLLGRTE